MKFLSLLIILKLLFVAIVLSDCAVDTSSQADVEADTEALTTCWNTSAAGLPGGFPPYDVMTTAIAMKQRAGGSWKPCTCDSGPFNCTCPRLVGAGRVVGHWVGFVGGQAQMTGTYFADGSNTLTYGETVNATDWDDDVFWHANTSPFPNATSGSIAVTLISGNSWNIHHCINQ